MPLKFVIRACCTAGALLLCVANAADRKPSLVGAARDEVIARFGEPKSHIVAGNREVLIFPGERIVLRDNRVIEAEQLAIDTPPAPKPAPVAPVTPDPSATTAAPASTAQPRSAADATAPAPDANAAPTPAVPPPPPEPEVIIKSVRPPSRDVGHPISSESPASAPTESTTAASPVVSEPVATSAAAASPASVPSAAPQPAPPPSAAAPSTPTTAASAAVVTPPTPSVAAVPAPEIAAPASAATQPAPTPSSAPAANAPTADSAATPATAPAEAAVAGTTSVPATSASTAPAAPTAVTAADSTNAANISAPSPKPSAAPVRKKREPAAPSTTDRIFSPSTYVIAVVIIVGGIGFLIWRRRQRVLMLEATAVSRSPFAAENVATASTSVSSGTRFTQDFLHKLEWKRFEELVAAYYNKTGVVAARTKTGPMTPVHIRISWKGEQRPFACVQCLPHPTGLIEAKPLQALCEVLASEDVRRGYVVTSGKFAVSARDLAEEKHITLLSGDLLLEKLNALPEAARSELMKDAIAGDYATPSCPTCETKMARAGGDSWSCPQCGTTLPRA